MPRHVSTGTCSFCQATVSKGTMTRHLGACKPRQALNALPSDPEKSRRTTLLHLVVEGYTPYWLHLEVRADATLKTLDAFLRAL